MSSDKQEASVPAQRIEVARLAQELSATIVREYVDEGISGDATEKRKAFQQMIRDGSARQFDAILVWDVDRFGRFDSIEAGYWIKPLRDAGVRLITVSQGEIRWHDFGSRIVAAVQQEAKHAYLASIAKDSLRGKVMKAQRGEWVGGLPPYGYAVVGKRLVVDPETAGIVRHIFDRYLEGVGLRVIARELSAAGIPSPASKAKGRSGIWSGNSIRLILMNEAYLGIFRWNKETTAKFWRVEGGRTVESPRDNRRHHAPENVLVIHDNHEAIIDRETFERAQKRRTERATYSSPSPERFLFTGLLVCPVCGSPMHGRKQTATLAYGCSTYQKFGNRYCRRNAVREDLLLESIAETFEKHVLHPENVAKIEAAMRRIWGRADSGSQRASLAKKLTAVNRKLDAAKKRLLEIDRDMLEVAQEQIRDLWRQKESLEKELAEAAVPRSAKSVEQKIEQAIEKARDWLAVLGGPKKLESRETLHTTLEKIVPQVTGVAAGQVTHWHLTGGTLFFRDCGFSALFSTSRHTSQVRTLPLVVRTRLAAG